MQGFEGNVKAFVCADKPVAMQRQFWYLYALKVMGLL